MNFSITCPYCDKTNSIEKAGMVTVRCETCHELFTDRAGVSVGSLRKTLDDSGALHSLGDWIQELRKLVNVRTAQPHSLDVNDLHGELRKALANPLTADQIDQQQERSRKFQTRGPRPIPADSPWL